MDQNKIAIVYASRHGCTGKCARELQKKLERSSEIYHLKKDPLPDLSSFNAIIIGGSIHIGKMSTRVRDFVSQNLTLLLGKKIGLFVCCMEEGEKAREQFRNAYPETLLAHAAATGIFGGELDFERMNWLERSIMRKRDIQSSVSNIDHEAIREFAGKFLEGTGK